MDPIKQTKNQYRLEEWQAIIKGQRASGESIRTYCQNNGIKEASYYYWLKKIRKTAMEEKGGATTFVSVPLDDVNETVSHPAASTAGILNPHPDAGGHHHDPGWRLPGNHPGRPEGHDRVMLGDITRADKIYIACGYTDMRKAIDGLAAIVRENFHMNPMENNLFLFCGKRRDRLKALYWEGDGFILLYKRLEDGYVKTIIM